jgi:hypothetical protein
MGKHAGKGEAKGKREWRKRTSRDVYIGKYPPPSPTPAGIPASVIGWGGGEGICQERTEKGGNVKEKGGKDKR